MNPIVSVIIPNYNHQLFLEQRLKSIFHQSFQDFEVILLDDKSTDNSIQILSKFATHPKVSHFIVNEQNSGSPFKQWEQGISLAKGKYIWIAESDDYSAPSFLEKTVSILEGHHSIGLISVYSQIVDENDNNMKSTKEWLSPEITNGKEKLYIENGLSFISREMLYKNAIHNASGVLFRRELTQHIDLDYTSFRQAGDVAFWIELLRQADIAILKENLNFWRKHSNSVTKQNYKKASLVMAEHLRIISYLKKKKDTHNLEHFLPEGTLPFNDLIQRWYHLNRFSMRVWSSEDRQFLLAGQKLDKLFIFRCLRAWLPQKKKRIFQRLNRLISG